MFYLLFPKTKKKSQPSEILHDKFNREVSKLEWSRTLCCAQIRNNVAAFSLYMVACTQQPNAITG